MLHRKPIEIVLTNCALVGNIKKLTHSTTILTCYLVLFNYLKNHKAYGKVFWIQNTCFTSLSNFCLKYFLLQQIFSPLCFRFIYAETHVNLHVKCLLLFFNFDQNWNMSTLLIKFLIIKVHDSLFFTSWVITCGLMNGQVDRNCK